MLKNEENTITREAAIDAREIAELARKLPQKEKERFYYMMKGAELVSAGMSEEPLIRPAG
ncbi:MAG: hypothetical protein VB047_09315 [Anaerotignum propionicum]|uniref:hypothetical protein n=1 Tax=Anaerotignum propionicum TaxID=28446 RepID=UPI002B1EA6C3|nr:hypothetical protein [Anaerotignum propionicum]MEA5057738.1 hypothetical protein [Anaerotignum propionicum]